MFTGKVSPRSRRIPRTSAIASINNSQGKFYYLAVLIPGHHGPVVFVFGDGTDADSDLACLRRHVCSGVHLRLGTTGQGLPFRISQSFLLWHGQVRAGVRGKI